MKNVRIAVVACVLGLASSGVFAQAASGPGRGMGQGPGMMQGAGPAGSAARMGPGGRMARWGSDFTPGWSLMNDQERNTHRERMRSAKTYEECKALQEEHRAQMAARAKAHGGKALPTPRRDGCAGLKR
jgi:hypothetical protein